MTTQNTKKHKRTELIVAAIKTYIATRALLPGDKLPQENELIAVLDASKGTVREALRMLEGQGLVESKTGPGGGVFIAQPGTNKTMELLSNYFFFNPPSIQHIYELRKTLEPLLVQSLAGKLDDSAYARLETIMTHYASDPKSSEQAQAQRKKELEFHLELCKHSDNSFLSLVCQFAIQFLMELSVCQEIYAHPNPSLRGRGYDYQQQLMQALRKECFIEAAHIMREHMQAAEEMMSANEITLRKDFIQAPAFTHTDNSKEFLALSGFLNPEVL